MNINEIFPSKYVKAGDLGGRPVTVEIERMLVEKIGVPPKLEDKPVLYFKGAKKAMVLNRTNAMTIAALYSPETNNWAGNRITLYPTRVSAFGDTHEVIRVKPEIPPSRAPVDLSHFDTPNPTDDEYDDPTASEIDDTSNGQTPHLPPSTPATEDISFMPSEEHLELANKWRGPIDAQMWAVDEGYCENKFEAQNSWKKIVTEKFKGVYNERNKKAVFVAFIDRQLEKAEESLA